MSSTNIEYFNSYLKMFVNSIINTFPEYKEILSDYYKELLENDSNNNDKYVKRFVKKMKVHKKLIANKDDSLFNESIYVLKNVDFKNIWDSGELSENNKEKIWDYIHTLFIISETIMNDSDTIKKLVESFKKLKNDTSLDENTQEETTENKIEELPDNVDNEEESNNNLDKEIYEMLKNLSSQKKEPIDQDFLEKGLLGQLANELSQEINLDSMNLNLDESNNVEDVLGNLISGDNPLKFMNLIQTVGQKIQSKVENGEFKQDDLFNEAKKMMGNFGGNSKLFDELLKTEPDQELNLTPTQKRLRKKLDERKK
jgi:hypothetical protein